jgi:DNA-binding transcriptional ArsR family regulator
LLRAAGLIAERRDGNRIHYRLEDECLAAAVGSFLTSICPVDVIKRRGEARRTAV